MLKQNQQIESMLRLTWLCFLITKKLVLNLLKEPIATCVSKSLNESMAAWVNGVKKTTSDACTEVSYSQQIWPMLSIHVTPISINQLIHPRFKKVLY